jgi:DNA-binding NarL/FixJ family response regulator
VSVILVVDDHGVYRSELRKLLETSLSHCRVVETSKLPHSGIDQTFNLILIDSDSLGHDTPEILAEWHEVRPTTRFAVISASRAKAEALHFLSTGFHGFLHKLQSNEELLAGVHDLLVGRIYLPSCIFDGNADGDEISFRDNVKQETVKLTPRQNEVLALLARGMSNKEIARELKIAEGTSKIHTAALLRAIGARNRTEAVFKGARFIRSKRYLASPDDEAAEFRKPWPDRIQFRKNPLHSRSHRKSGQDRAR